jgi:hypothetical protein
MFTSLTLRRFLFLLSTTALFGAAIYYINHRFYGYNIWAGFTLDEGVANFFCEYTDMNKVIRQPMNTFSNFIYWVGGVAILLRGWKDQSRNLRYNLISANPFYSITFGIILIYTFLASTFFHSSLAHVAGRMDYSAVFSLSLYPLMYFTHRVTLLVRGLPSNERHPKETSLLIIGFSLAYLSLNFFTTGFKQRYWVLAIIAIMIIFAWIVEFKDKGRTHRKYLWICISAIAIAILAFGADSFRNWPVFSSLCNPHSFIQPHSMWHLFSGISAFYFYMYIRSDNNYSRNPNAVKPAG